LRGAGSIRLFFQLQSASRICWLPNDGDFAEVHFEYSSDTFDAAAQLAGAVNAFHQIAFTDIAASLLDDTSDAEALELSFLYALKSIRIRNLTIFNQNTLISKLRLSPTDDPGRVLKKNRKGTIKCRRGCPSTRGVGSLPRFHETNELLKSLLAYYASVLVIFQFSSLFVDLDHHAAVVRARIESSQEWF